MVKQLRPYDKLKYQISNVFTWSYCLPAGENDQTDGGVGQVGGQSGETHLRPGEWQGPGTSAEEI